jgi:hypothetical protein
MFIALASATAAAEPTLRWGALPTASPRAAELRAAADAVAHAIAPVAVTPPSFALGATVARADALGAAGRLDEAAALFDVAIDEGERAPLQVADGAALVHAHVARATIGLARGEGERAEALMARVLRWDPTFRPSATDETPRLLAVLDGLRERLGPRPPLSHGDAGESCADEYVVARPIGDGIELVRLVGCRPVAATVARGASGADATTVPPPAALATALGWTAPATPRSERTPVYRRAWFWVTLAGAAVVAVGTGVGIWAATRGPVEWNVTPHL